MLEKYLIEHCSPTLASLKTANLFSMDTSSCKNLEREIESWNQQLKAKGIEMIILKNENSRALIYVCRKKQLANDLNQPGAATFMKKYGYDSIDVDYAMNVLKSKLANSSNFPHEIGMFLGYPLGDVIGFIENAGKNCKCVGCWKVYCNECQAIKTFAKFEKCRNVYKNLWQKGRQVMQLTVAA